jgi:acyl carrier protein
MAYDLKMGMTRTSFVRALEEIFGLERLTLREDSSRDTLEEWTSLADVQIFSLIESEFGIEPSEELLSAETVGELLRILQNLRAFRE